MNGASPACSHRPPCPGCPRFGEPGIPAAARDALLALAHTAGLPPPVVIEGAADGHRCRARLAVRGRVASPKVGLFQEGTHRIVDIPACVVHHRSISCNLDVFLGEVRALLDEGRIRLAALTPFALFPYTRHVETVALFEAAA